MCYLFRIVTYAEDLDGHCVYGFSLILFHVQPYPHLVKRFVWTEIHVTIRTFLSAECQVHNYTSLWPSLRGFDIISKKYVSKVSKEIVQPIDSIVVIWVSLLLSLASWSLSYIIIVVVVFINNPTTTTTTDTHTIITTILVITVVRRSCLCG